MENIKSIILEEVKKALKEKDKEKEKKKVTKKSSIKDKLSSIKDNDDNNELSKLKTLMDIIEDEGRAYVGLAKAAQGFYKEHDYEKLKAEADRYTALADECEVKYQKLEARYNKMVDDKKASKKKPETSDKKPKAEGDDKPAAEKKEDKKEKLDEGVWSVLPKRIPEFIKAVENLKDEYYGVVGSDAVFDGLDNAIMEAEKLMSITPLKESKVLFKIKK